MPSLRLLVVLLTPALTACPRAAPAFAALTGAHVEAGLEGQTQLHGPLESFRAGLGQARDRGAETIRLAGYTLVIGLFDDGSPTHTLRLTWVTGRRGAVLAQIAREPGSHTSGAPLASLVADARVAAEPIAELAATLVGPACAELPTARATDIEALGLPLTPPDRARLVRAPADLGAVCAVIPGHPIDDLNVRVESITWLALDRQGSAVGLVIASPSLSRGALTIPDLRFEDMP